MIDLSGRLASGDTLYGTFLGLGSALAAEACALAGFDWLLVDLEHGGGDESELLPQQLAADAHAVPLLLKGPAPPGHAPRAPPPPQSAPGAGPPPAPPRDVPRPWGPPDHFPPKCSRAP